MTDYSQMSEGELGRAIQDVFGRAITPGWHLSGEEESSIRHRDYLHNDGATWQAFLELPAPSIEFIMEDGKAWWGVSWTVCTIYADELRSVSDPEPARAVWIAWLTWKESKR